MMSENDVRAVLHCHQVNVLYILFKVTEGSAKGVAYAV